MTDQKRRLSPSKLEFEERRRISFHIAGVRGLHQSGWQPIASTYVHLESLETQQSFNTEYRKTSPSIIWGENIPIMDLKDSSKVRFEVRSHMLWNRTVLGRTETFTVSDLIKMQKVAGEERGAYIDLVLTPTTPIFPLKPSPPGHRRTKSTPAGVKVPLSSTRLRTSLLPSKAPSLPALGNIIILSLSIRETAAKDRNHTLTAAAFQRFVEKCQIETLVELQACVEKLVGLRNAFHAEGSPLVSLLDIVLGAAEGVRKTIANPATRNINQNTVACVKALNGALSPYQNLSARQLEKLGENAAQLMREMLCGAVRALESIDVFLGMENAYARDKFEFKVTGWLRYFEDCERYLRGTDPNKPDALIHKKLQRVRSPSRMVANPELPKHNMLQMTLPEVYENDTYNRSNVLLVSEWIFSSSTHRSSIPKDNDFATNRGNNIMCLSGPSGSGKTQLAAHLSQWLAELGCLGGYFTFDHQLGLSPSATLDALPLTLIHQVATVEPDLTRHLAAAFSRNPTAATQPLETRFAALFGAPMQALVGSRLPAGGAWNPLAPLVFVIDGLGASAAGTTGMAGAFAEWMAGKGVRALPPHVKFLLLARPEAGLEAALRQRGAHCVYAEMEPEVHCVPCCGVESAGARKYAEPVTMDSPASLSSPTFKVLIQSF